MSETNSKIAKVACVAIDGIGKVLPIQRLESVSCLYRWLDSCYKLNAFGRDYIEADYYNGSEDDIKNLLLEILALATTDHCFNGKFVLERLKFLANEGLHIIELQNSHSHSFKLSEKEANDLIIKLTKKGKKVSKAKATKNLKKAVADYKKNLISSEGLSSLKRQKRDNKGRFLKKK